MTLKPGRLAEVLARYHETTPLSGVVAIDGPQGRIFGQAFGDANRAEGVPNTLGTRFAVASGCKIFTSVAVAQLVQAGHFAFDSPLRECLAIDFPHFDPGVTVHHLLTHTSGIPSYFDEEGGQDYAELWHERPMYRMTRLRDFLPMFREERQVFPPGERFAYNDGAFIVLGLLVEQHAGMAFTEYVEQRVFSPCGMNDSGYFRLDQLPARTAQCYLEDESGAWRTNIYSVPVIGGPDGGAYTTAADMTSFWQALFARRLLDAPTTATLLGAQSEVPGEDWATHYGYGVWIREDPRVGWIHYVEGWDPGVAFLSVAYPQPSCVLTVLLNENRSVWKVLRELLPLLEEAD